MKRRIYILSISILLGGCASLTKTQIESVNQFAQTSKNFSVYPSKIITELADIRLKRGVYYANFYCAEPKAYVNELDSAYNEKNRDYKLSAKSDITFKIIDKYAQSLLLLSSDKYTTDLEKQSKNFGTDIDSLINVYNKIGGVNKIPSGIGGLASQLIILGGDAYIKTKQAKEIKKFVPKADTLISIMTANLKEFLNGKVYIKELNNSYSIEDLIKNENDGIKEGYKAYIASCARLKAIPTIESENEYLQLKNSLDGTDILLKQTIKATDDLRTAHKKLLNVIEKKKTLTENIKELQAYYEEVKNIKSTIEKIEKPKK
ncbi:MAG: hypothetical protein WC223_06055 [Bacteroidales bacterium]|jgi:hypothetical protein